MPLLKDKNGKASYTLLKDKRTIIGGAKNLHRYCSKEDLQMAKSTQKEVPHHYYSLGKYKSKPQ